MSKQEPSMPILLDDLLPRSSSPAAQRMRLYRGRKPLRGRATRSAGGGSKKIEDNPMDQNVEARLANLRRAARCGAMTRAGTPCQRPAIRGPDAMSAARRVEPRRTTRP